MTVPDIAHDFLYVSALEHNPNQPAVAWVSDCPDDINPRTEENPHLLTYDETDPNGTYLVVAHRHNHFLDIDIDVEKGHDAHVTFDIEEVNAPHGALFFSSPSGGRHIVLRLTEDFSGLNGIQGVDLQSDMQGTLGMFTSPFHTEGYEVIQDGATDVWWDGTLEGLEMEEYSQEQVFAVELLQFGENFDTDFELEISEDAPDEMPTCLHELFQYRAELPEDSEIDAWYVDSAIGRRLVAFGYEYERAVELLAKYEPRDGFDERETRYQLRRLYQKELHPDSRSTLESNGVEISHCSCRFCNNAEDFIASDPVHANEWEVDTTDGLPNIVMPSIARTGKSYTMVGEAARLLKRDEFSDKQVVYISSAHSEAEATVQKFKEHGIRDVGYLMGRDRAQKEYNVRKNGEYRETASARTPQEAAQLNNCDQYLALEKGCNEAQVVVTVPEKLEKIGERDWVIMTEEAAFSRMLSTSVNVIDIEMHMNNDRIVKKKLGNLQSNVQDVIDRINDKDQTDYVDGWIQTAARKTIQICQRVYNWLPANWKQVEDSWDTLVDDINTLLDDIAYERPPDLEQARTRLDDHQDVRMPLLNVMFSDGVHEYTNNEKKQLFIIGDCDMLFIPLPDGCETFWTAGNSVPHMEHFQQIAHNDDWQVKPFYGGVTPVQDSIRVIRYSGGENQNQQANHVQQSVEQFRAAFTKRRNLPGGLIISGSSKHCASHATRIRGCEQPSSGDDLEDVRYALEMGQLLAIPENSRYSEGVDTPEACFGALYNGNFATPREDYMAEQHGRYDLKRAEKTRAAQNSILRPSDVLKHTGSGITPVIVPDRHVPDEIWELFDEYGIDVWEQDDIADVRRLLVMFTEVDEDLEVHDGRIQHTDDTPTEAEAFKRLIREQASSNSGTAD